MKRAPRICVQFGREAFTLIELMVVILILSILASLLFPHLSRARERAHTIKCISNIRQIAFAVYAYSLDNDGLAPLAGYREDYDANGDRVGWPHADIGPASSLSFATRDYHEDPDIFVCPLFRRRPSSYLFACAHGLAVEGLLTQEEADLRSIDGLDLGQVDRPTEKPMVFCASPTVHSSINYSMWAQAPFPAGRQVVAYVDTHVVVLKDVTWQNYFDLLFPPY